MTSSIFHADELWKNLVRATVDKKHPWRTPSLATQSLQGPNSRHIVLRQVVLNQHRLVFYTDVRSAKVADIHHDPRVALLFWNPRSMQQLRVWGQASVLDETTLLDQHWSRVPEGARKDYATLSAPGENYMGQFLDLDAARANFRLFVVDCTRMDYLQLSREGHVRVAYELGDGGVWKASRVEA